MGVRVRAVTEAEAVCLIADAAGGEGLWTITANLDHLRRYTNDPVAKQLIDSADLVVADGAPLVWASRIAGSPLPERVAGSSMLWSLCEAARCRGQSVFLLGGAPGVAKRAASVLTDRYPGLEIAGTACPPIGFEKSHEILERTEREVVDASPHIVLVGLGFPKQDLLIARLRKALPSASFIGIGIGLSFVAGDVLRAPPWTHRLGLEWMHRLLQEPERLARRYLLLGLPFGVRLLASAARHRIRNQGPTTLWGWDPESRASDLPQPLSHRIIDAV